MLIIYTIDISLLNIQCQTFTVVMMSHALSARLSQFRNILRRRISCSVLRRPSLNKSPAPARQFIADSRETHVFLGDILFLLTRLFVTP